MASVAQLVSSIFGRDGVLEFALDGEIEPFLGARFEFEAHARGIAQSANQTHGLIGEAVNGEGANFAVLDIREAVGGIEQAGRVKRDSER